MVFDGLHPTGDCIGESTVHKINYSQEIDHTGMPIYDILFDLSVEHEGVGIYDRDYFLFLFVIIFLVDLGQLGARDDLLFDDIQGTLKVVLGYFGFNLF